MGAEKPSGIAGLARRGSTYFLSNVLVQAGSLITFPLYARSLGPSGYGILSVLLALTSVLSALLILGLNTAVIRYAAGEGRDDARAVGTALVYVLAIGSASTAVVGLWQDWLLGIIYPSAPASSSWILPLAMAFVTVSATLQLVLAQATARNRARVYLLSATANTAVTLCTAIVIVGVLNAGVGGALAAMTAGAVTAVALTAVQVLPRGWPRFSPALLKKMALFGIGLLPMNIAAWALNLADRYLLSQYVTIDDVGRYSAAYKVGSLAVIFLIMPFRTAFIPFIFQASKQTDGPKVIGQVVRLFTLTSLWCGFALSAFGPELMRLFAGPEFVSAASVVPWVAAGTVMVGLTTAFSAGILLSGKTYLGAVSYGCAAGFNIALNLMMIPVLGILGAALATLLADSLLAIVFILLSYRLYRTPVGFPRVAVCLVWLCLAVLVCVMADRALTGSLLGLTVRVVAVLAFAASCAWGGGLTASERANAASALTGVGRWLSRRGRSTQGTG